MHICVILCDGAQQKAVSALAQDLADVARRGLVIADQSGSWSLPDRFRAFAGPTNLLDPTATRGIVRLILRHEPDVTRCDLYLCDASQSRLVATLSRAELYSFCDQQLAAEIKQQTGRTQADTFPRIADHTRTLDRCDVLIPYHVGTIQYAREAIESILSQTLGQRRLILHLVADGLLPRQDAIAQRFREVPCVRTYYQPQSGPYIAALRVFPHLETDAMAIQDADDIALPHRLEYSLNQLNSSGAELFGGAMQQFCDPGAGESARAALQAHPLIYSRWTASHRPDFIHSTLVVRKETFGRLGGYRDFRCGADVHFATVAAAAGCRVSFSDEIVGYRRLRSDSLLHSEETGQQSELRRMIAEIIRLDLARLEAGLCEPCDIGRLAQYQHDGQLTPTTESAA